MLWYFYCIHVDIFEIFLLVENIVFVRPSTLQLEVYRKLLSSRLLRSCLYDRGSAHDSTPHLVCIGSLKKLCNCPSLIYNDATKRDKVEKLYNFNVKHTCTYRCIFLY